MTSKISQTSRCVLLLRAVNVAGSGRLPMATLKRSLTDLGITSIETYLQSGNVVCMVPSHISVKTIENAVPVSNGTTVIRRTAEDIARILLKTAAWGLDDPTKVAIVFLENAADEADMDQLLNSPSLKRGNDTVRKVGDKDLVLEYPNGAGRAALTLKAIEKVLHVKGTGRNFRTVKALEQMVAH